MPGAAVGPVAGPMAGSVGVVVAARNAARFVDEAVRSALGQTAPPDVVVVVDDGSTDATADLAGAIDDRVVVLRRPHRGVGPSRNEAIAATGTDLVAFLDADDLWLPEKLARQQVAFAADPALEACFTLFDEFLDLPEGVEPGSLGIRPPRTRQAASVASGALLRRAVVDRLGPFGDGPVGDWVQWWARARALDVREHVVPEVLWRRRLHGRNNSLLRGDQGRTFLDIVRAHHHERRARPPAGSGEPR